MMGVKVYSADDVRVSFLNINDCLKRHYQIAMRNHEWKDVETLHLYASLLEVLERFVVGYTDDHKGESHGTD